MLRTMPPPPTPLAPRKPSTWAGSMGTATTMVLGAAALAGAVELAGRLPPPLPGALGAAQALASRLRHAKRLVTVRTDLRPRTNELRIPRHLQAKSATPALWWADCTPAGGVL